MKRLVAVLIMSFLATAASAQLRPVPGKEYRPIDPPQPVSGAKIEVIEFFNYACSHCYEFEPLLKSWLSAKPADVEFRYVPAVFNERMVPLAKLHYALEETGLLTALHDKVYDAIHRKAERLIDRESIVKWVAAQGVDTKKFEASYDSFSVGNKAQKAIQMTRNYRIPGTPYIVVNGKYLTGPSMTLKSGGGIDTDRFVQVLNGLIDMERRR